MSKIKFKTQITEKDMGLFNIYVTYRKISGIFTLLMGLVAVFLSILAFKGGRLDNGFVFLLTAALFFLYFPWMHMKKGKRAVESNPVFSKPLFYTVDEKGISIDQRSEHALLSWEKCLKAVETSKAIYVFSGPRTAFIWPKDQLGNDLNEVKKIIKENMAPSKCGGIKVK